MSSSHPPPVHGGPALPSPASSRPSSGDFGPAFTMRAPPPPSATLHRSSTTPSSASSSRPRSLLVPDDAFSSGSAASAGVPPPLPTSKRPGLGPYELNTGASAPGGVGLSVEHGGVGSLGAGSGGGGGMPEQARVRRPRALHLSAGGGDGLSIDGRGRSRRRRKKWKKLLWVNQSYPDNYTDQATFLENLQRNPRLQPYAFWPLVADSTVIVQHVCSVIVFVVCFVGIFQERVSPVAVVGWGSLLTAAGWLVWDMWQTREERELAAAAAAAAVAAVKNLDSAGTGSGQQPHQQQQQGQQQQSRLKRDYSSASMGTGLGVSGNGPGPGYGNVNGQHHVPDTPSNLSTYATTSPASSMSNLAHHAETAPGRMSPTMVRPRHSPAPSTSSLHSAASSSVHLPSLNRDHSALSLSRMTSGVSTANGTATTTATTRTNSNNQHWRTSRPPSTATALSPSPPSPVLRAALAAVNATKQHGPSRAHLRLGTIKSAVLIYFTLLGLSPILKSLTRSTSSDSIWAMSFWLLAVNIFFFDYSTENHRGGSGSTGSGGATAVNSPPMSSHPSVAHLTQLASSSSQPQSENAAETAASAAAAATVRAGRMTSRGRRHFPASLSTNAALMASTVLASRLPSTGQVFSLTLFSIEVFGLFPVFRRAARRASWRVHVALTTALVVGAGGGVGIVVLGDGRDDDGGRWIRNALVGVIVGALVAAVAMGGCSWWLIGLQKYKNEIYGPWDQARPVIMSRRHWDDD